MATIHRATLLSFDLATYTAQVLIEGSDVEALVAVGQWLPASMMVVDANVAVLLFDPTNTDDAVIIGPYGGAPLQTAIVTEGGLNLGSASSAGAGELRTSGNIVIADGRALNWSDIGLDRSAAGTIRTLGTLNAAAFQVSGTNVVGTRKTGWGTPTGTQYRGALTNASTQAQFNQALMALIVDLISHGLIGA